MEYLPSKDIKGMESVKKRNSGFTGPTVRHGFSIKVIEKYIRGGGGARMGNVLDCGSAEGKLFLDLKSAGFENLYGVDIDDYLDPEYKKILKEFKTSDLSYEKLPWQDNFFSLVTAWCLVPHLENPFNFIREAHRILKTGGLLIYSTINITSPSHRKYFYKTGNFPGYHERNNHISIITPAIFRKTILRYFDLVGTEYFITPRIFDGPRGVLRKIAYGLSAKVPRLKLWLDDRWGAKIIYVLRKKQQPETAGLLDE